MVVETSRPSGGGRTYATMVVIERAVVVARCLTMVGDTAEHSGGGSVGITVVVINEPLIV